MALTVRFAILELAVYETIIWVGLSAILLLILAVGITLVLYDLMGLSLHRFAKRCHLTSAMVSVDRFVDSVSSYAARRIFGVSKRDTYSVQKPVPGLAAYKRLRA